MKVKAKHWLNHDGVWRHAGEEFEISTSDVESMAAFVEIAETPIEDVNEPEIPKKRGRPRKSDAE